MDVIAKPLQGAKVLVGEDEPVLALDMMATLSKEALKLLGQQRA
jgi:hypothetical protein